MVHEFNRRQPKIKKEGGLMEDDGAPAPTRAEWRDAKARLRAIALPDERF